uniref:Hypotheticial protein n=1 Tax=Schistosoma japonicum TaxID=6182 RepID=C7TYQ0_SCHJA|nr:hypotheticial protein [Schistosoma japonicum]
MLSLTNILTLPHTQLTTYLQARRTLPKAKPYTT